MFIHVKSIVSEFTPSGYQTDTGHGQQSHGTKAFNMTKKINFGKLLYFTAALISLSLFIFTTGELIVEYSRQKTGFNIVEHDKTELELPAATICITDTFQNVDIDGTETSPEEILSNLTAHTFSGNHIFYEDFEKLKEQYAIQETFSYKNGRCFTLTTSENQIKNAIGKPPMYLKLKKAHKYKVRLEIQVLVDDLTHFIKCVCFRLAFMKLEEKCGFKMT